MSGRKQKPYFLEKISIESVAAEGKAIAKHDGKVIFIPFAAPGDIADIKVTKQKKNFAEAQLIQIHHPSSKRVEAPCSHFGTCGGCKWQHVNYQEQLLFKSAQVENDMQRIAKVDVKEFLPILGSQETYAYRNKLEFTFSNKAWEENFDKENPGRIPALGFHIPGMFDKVLDLDSCHLAPAYANKIRHSIKQYAIDQAVPFFDIRAQTGYLRNLMVRCNRLGQWMAVIIIAEDKPEPVLNMIHDLASELSQVTEWCYVVNDRKNDTWTGLDVVSVKGNGYLTEKMENLEFKIRPQSFFQTNALQAYELYKITRDFAGLSGTENVYDLYTGTGSIALFVASQARFVTGIEYVEAAILDAKENAVSNYINNTAFYAGDMRLVLNDELIEKHGLPDVVITDPPRDGMHPDVLARIIDMRPAKIVYVSCNSSTQARDLAILDPFYQVEKIQAVDMFPHTHHVESVALLTKK